MLNGRSYSPTTSRHQRDAAYATQHGERLFVPMFTAPWSTLFVPEMVEQMERSQKAAEADSASRGPVKRERGLLEAQGIANAAKRLPAFLKGAGIKLGRPYATRLRKLAAWVPADREQLAERLKAAKQAEERRIKRAEAKRRKAEAERLAEWLKGQGSGTFEAMAIRERDGMAETTKGARVTLAAARLLWSRWGDSALHGLKVDGYTVTEARPDAIVIGCHVIDRQAAQDFARRQGWA